MVNTVESFNFINFQMHMTKDLQNLSTHICYIFCECYDQIYQCKSSQAVLWFRQCHHYLIIA
jgi:hypothetical protein